MYVQLNNMPVERSLNSSSPLKFETVGTGRLVGESVQAEVRRLGELAGVFADEAARRAMDMQQVVYRVQRYQPIVEGTVGGLYFGNTIIEPGLVGDEFFMTKGHFHAKRDRGEYYWCLSGQGLLLLMDESRGYRVEVMQSASLHYIPGHTAHRCVNTGDDSLVFGACWPSDAGHDYEAIATDGFSVRVLRVNGEAQLVDAGDGAEGNNL